jgi:DNA invertase Pin-like site-specific DNA recombinase
MTSTDTSAPKRVVLYRRVSTINQQEDGHGLDAQTTQLQAFVASRGWTVVADCADTASGATTKKRPELARAIELCETGQADVIVVTKIDRVSRSAADFANLLCQAQNNGWALVIVELGLDLTTPMGAFTAQIMCSVAELERKMIAQRTKEGLAAARAKGVQLGRRSNVPADVLGRIVAERETGLSLRAIAEVLNDSEVPTVAGGTTWRASSVAAILKSAEPR